jgi:hypothetical protein
MAILSIERLDSETVEGLFKSDISGKVTKHKLKITKAELDDWIRQQRVSVFNSLSDEEKELFITGMSNEEWNELFTDE